jgi:hypothetical protein
LHVNSRFLHAHRFLFGVVLTLVLAMRVLVPAGWMPSGSKGQMITICTGMGLTQAWLGDDGRLHKQTPAEKQQGDQPCMFAGLSAASLASGFYAPALPPVYNNAVTDFWLRSSSVGHGLAAPPPPATGPPHLI